MTSRDSLTRILIIIRKVAFVNRGWVPRTAASWSRPAEKMEILVILTEEEKVKVFIIYYLGVVLKFYLLFFRKIHFLHKMIRRTEEYFGWNEKLC